MASLLRQGIQCCNKKFSQRQGVKKTLLGQGKSLSRHRVQSQQYKATQLYSDKEKFVATDFENNNNKNVTT